MALIEDELIKEDLATLPPAPLPVSTTSYLPAGAVPGGKDGNLSALAGEFWFPECRDCVCCQGFKHGCACCKTSGALQCTEPFCGGLTTPSLQTGYSTTPAVRRSVPPPVPATASTASSQPICSFYQSGACRFGTSCRFRHVGSGGITATSTSVAGKGPSKDMCR